jgi:Asparagine synthase
LLVQEYGSTPHHPATLQASGVARLWAQAEVLRRLREAAFTRGKVWWKRAHLPRPAFAKAALQVLHSTNLPVSLRERYDLYRSVFTVAGARTLLHPSISFIPTLSAQSAYVSASGCRLDPLTFGAARDVKTYLLDDILTKVDRTSMANSLEVRVPFLDHTLVELAFAMPPSLKLRAHPMTQQLVTKYLLKQSAARFYSEEFLHRPKMGFGIPVAAWLRASLKGFLEEELCNPRHPMFDWLQFAVVQEILTGLFAGDDGRAPQVWCLLMFGLWMRHVHLAR